MSAGPLPSVLRGFAGGLIRTPMRLVGSFSEALKRRHCRVGAGTVLLPPARVENLRRERDAIRVGDHCRVAGQLLVFAHGGSVSIGDHCFVGESSRIWSANAITIGHRVLISHGVNIHDTNAHSLSARQRHEHILEMFSTGHPRELPDVPDRPIVIEDDAWIGFNAVVLKGVRIGRGAVIGAASVVTHDVPAYSVVVGNPARIVGSALP